MSNDRPARVEVITGVASRRYLPAHEKLRVVEESLAPGESVSAVARRNGVAPNLLFRWRRLMAEGGAMAVGKNEPVVGASELRKLEDRVRDLERLLGRKTKEVEILKEALAKSGAKTDVAAAVAAEGRFPIKAAAETIGVSRSQLHARASGTSKPRGRYRKAEDDELLPAPRRLVDERPTYGYRRIAALLNRERRLAGLEPVNRKRVLRILNLHGLTLEQSTGRREGRVHDGKIAVMASNLRWCSDACEITHWNGEKVRVACIIDAFDREVIAHVAVTGAGVSGSDVRDMMLAAVERRFGTDRVPSPVEHLSDNGSCYIAGETQDFARQLGLVPCFTPVRSPESNGMAEAFVKTLKRDCVRITPLPDAATVLGLVPAWIDNYNTVHPYSALAMRSPVEFRSALNPSQAVR